MTKLYTRKKARRKLDSIDDWLDKVQAHYQAITLMGYSENKEIAAAIETAAIFVEELRKFNAKIKELI